LRDIKKEMEIDDPMELQGVACDGNQDMMVVAIIEEYIRAGFTTNEVFRLFKDPFYPTLNRAFLKMGSKYIYERIDETAKKCGIFIFESKETDEPVPATLFRKGGENE
jgi:hypothetical protein